MQVHVVGELFEQFLDAGEDFGWIGVVGGQGAARRQCQPVVRRRGLQFVQVTQRAGTVVPLEGALHFMEPVVQLGLRQFQQVN